MRKLINLIITIILFALCIWLMNRVQQLEQAVQHYEERQLSLISQDKAIRKELADLKWYIQTGEASGG